MTSRDLKDRFYLSLFVKKETLVEVSQMKKIGIILDNITSGNGTERAVTNLANILADNYSVYIISVSSSEGTYFKLNSNVKIIHVNLQRERKRSFFQKITAYPKQYAAMWKKFNELQKLYNFDCLIGTHFSFNFVLSKMKKPKTVGCEHFNYGVQYLYTRVIRRFLYPKLDRVVVLTKADSTHYTFIKKERLCVIPNSLSFIPPEAEPAYSSRKMLAIGRLKGQKGFDMLVAACALLKERLKDTWTLEIIGEGDDYDKLIKQINESKLDKNISITKPRHDIISAYKSACCYVMSSRYEGLPMVLIEAQSCGLPCISFDCKEGPAEVIHNGEDGFLVEADNIEKLADAMYTILTEENLCRTMGKKALEASSRFTTSNIKDLWMSMLSSLGV